MLRLVGAATIIIACGMVGIIISRSYLMRPRFLYDLSVALQLLETEIDYSRTNLAEACFNIAQQVKQPVSQFLTYFSEALETNEGISAEEAWNIALVVLVDAGFLQQDVEAIKYLGTVLGRSDAPDQLKHIATLQKRIQLMAQNAETDRDKNVRLWNYLGFCIGALVVLLLI